MNQTVKIAQTADVIVVGGGMVGGLTAAAFARCGLEVTVLEKRLPAPFSVEQHDIRVSAISYATERMFEAVGAWEAMRAMRVCPFRRMLVWDRLSEASTLFDSKKIDQDWLGHIVENRVIQSGLWQCLQELPNVRLMCPASLQSLSIDDNQARIQLDCGFTLTAPLIIAADGAQSLVRELAGIDVDGESYAQHALVATVTTESSQQDITWQRFTPEGPQAFLPLCGNRASMVWYQSAEVVAELKELPEHEFLQRMQAEFPDRLARLLTLESRGSFPLHWQQAKSYVVPRVALVGDAAHSVHPLAGQGVNMGMLDAAALVECVMDRYHAGADIGSLRTLRRYERWRRGENKLMIKLLDGIHHTFQDDGDAAGGMERAVLKTARAVALRAAGNVGPINKLCMRMAMGLEGELPALARGRLPLREMPA